MIFISNSQNLLQVSITLLVCSTVYLKIFLVETINKAARPHQHVPCSTMAIRIFQERWNSMKDTIVVVASRSILLPNMPNIPSLNRFPTIFFWFAYVSFVAVHTFAHFPCSVIVTDGSQLVGLCLCIYRITCTTHLCLCVWLNLYFSESLFLFFCSGTLKHISLISFFYELGMSGISSILLVYIQCLTYMQFLMWLRC